MNAGPRARKLLLTLHVLSSVGWFGAVAGFLALAVAGLGTADGQLARGVYLAMPLLGWCAIVPMCAGSFVTGVVQALVTPWGLFRHYWVIIKLVIAIGATILLLVHMQPIDFMKEMAAAHPLATADHHDVRLQLVFDAAAALVALTVATVLSVYKPRGTTPYGWRKQREEASAAPENTAKA